jgi:hypothetical protein
VENGLFKRNGMMLEVGLGAGLLASFFVHICIVRVLLLLGETKKLDGSYLAAGAWVLPFWF